MKGKGNGEEEMYDERKVEIRFCIACVHAVFFKVSELVWKYE